MCMNADNTSPKDIEALGNLVQSLDEGALKDFLAMLHGILSTGGAICMGMGDAEGNFVGPLPSAEDGPAPGIYPPDAFN